MSSWLTSLLQRLPVKEQLQKAHTRTMLSHGTNSPSTSEPSALATTSSLTHPQDPNETRSLAPLPWLSGEDSYLQQLMTPWLWEQSKISSWIYLQPSGKMDNPTQPRTTIFSLASFYNADSEPTKMPTQGTSAKSQPCMHDCQKCQTKIDRAPVCNLTTHQPCLLLCHAFVQVRHGSATGERTNQNPPHPKSLILQ
jgi:hypothetical protein